MPVSANLALTTPNCKLYLLKTLSGECRKPHARTYRRWGDVIGGGGATRSESGILANSISPRDLVGVGPSLQGTWPIPYPNLIWKPNWKIYFYLWVMIKLRDGSPHWPFLYNWPTWNNPNFTKITQKLCIHLLYHCWKYEVDISSKRPLNYHTYAVTTASSGQFSPFFV
jgi:hypothetical protein